MERDEGRGAVSACEISETRVSAREAAAELRAECTVQRGRQKEPLGSRGREYRGLARAFEKQKAWLRVLALPLSRCGLGPA